MLTRTRLTLRPGQNGTKKLVAKYGERLVAVRYRYDPEACRRVKTVELIEEEVAWIRAKPPVVRKPDELVFVKVDFLDLELRGLLKQAGGRWDPGRKAWRVRYAVVLDLGIHSMRVESS